MSADLFAAFGNSCPPSQPPTSSVSNNNNQGNRAHPDNCNHGPPGSLPSPPEQIFQELAVNDTSRYNEHGAEVLFDASTEYLESDSEDEWGEFESAELSSKENKSTALPHEKECGTDLMGDFISGDTDDVTGKTAIQPVSSALPTTDLLSVDVEARDIAPKAQATHPPNKLSTKLQPKPIPSTGHPDEDDEDDWGDFIDGVETNTKSTLDQSLASSPIQPSTPPVTQNQSTSTIQQTNSSGVKPARREESSVRPTNIPPPSIILPLFPPLLEELQKTASVYRNKGENSGSPKTTFADELVRSSKVMAHVLAGRQLRWKRDQILSQSTKIGPARSGKSGGMKLSSVNKTENVKEENEAVEVVETWKKYSALLNSVVSAAGRRPVPLVSINMQVRTANSDEGALKATHACALCGLKRDERIPKIDQNVNDSFGEWWVDHWGHSGCKEFWEANSTRLDHR